jgi:hypothetical protein
MCIGLISTHSLILPHDEYQIKYFIMAYIRLPWLGHNGLFFFSSICVFDVKWHLSIFSVKTKIRKISKIIFEQRYLFIILFFLVQFKVQKEIFVTIPTDCQFYIRILFVK